MDREVQKQPLSVWLRKGFILGPLARTGLADSAPRVKVGQTVGCSTFTRGAKPATRRVADGERMNPLGEGVRVRANTGDVELQDDDHLESGPREGSALVPRAYGLVGPAVSPP
jgi:hypothetical protein